MPVDLWFPLALYYEDLPEGAAHRDVYRGYIEDTLEEAAQSRRFAWTGDVHGYDRIHEDPRFGWLTEAVGVHAWRYLDLLGYDLDEIEVHIQRSWPVISEPGQEVARHSHHDAHLSAVYFVAAANDSGLLQFTNIARQNELAPGAHNGTTSAYREFHPLNFGSSVYEPVEGRLVIFPAKQPHEVQRNDSASTRLSVSFDLVLSTRWDRPGAAHEFLMPPPERWRRVPRPEPNGTVRTDRPMELVALSRGADALDTWSLPATASHPLWRSTVHRHCASQRDWFDHQARDLEAASDDAEAVWHDVPATPDGWSTFRNAVDRIHHQLASADVSTLGATVTAPAVLTHRTELDQPFARAATALAAYLRLDHGDGACAIELEEESEVVAVEPGSLVVVSGYRRHRVLGEATLLRFGVDVPTLARPLRPDALTGAAGAIDDRTAFSMATAVPLAAPVPSSDTVAHKLAQLDLRRRRRYRHHLCPVVRSYLLDGADPRAATEADRAVIRLYGITTDEIVDGPPDHVRRVPLLDSGQCTRLIAFGRERMRAVVPDSVDDLPEYQVNLDVGVLTDVVGAETVRQLLSLAPASGTCATSADEPPPVSFFLRVFSPESRPYITFHSDVSCWTVNVPLDNDDPGGGGRLLMLYGGALREEARSPGVALSHSGAMVHGVSRIKAGQRWSLIALFHAGHPSGTVEEETCH